MSSLMSVAEAALDAAGVVIRPYFRAGVAADQKTDESPVTVADRMAEETLRRILGEAFPDFGIMGEEFPDHNIGAKHVWVIDPIDGTRAFITGRTSFCTLVGLLEDGVPVLGFIDQPVTGERWSGGRGGAAAVRGDFGGGAAGGMLPLRSGAISAGGWARAASHSWRRRNCPRHRLRCWARRCRASRG